MQSNTQKTKSNELSYTILAGVLVLCLIFWGIIFVSTTSDRDYFERSQQLSYQEGSLDSYDDAWREGRNQGYLETETLAEYEGLIGQAESYNDGWRFGYETGRDYGYYGYDYR